MPTRRRFYANEAEVLCQRGGKVCQRGGKYANEAESMPTRRKLELLNLPVVIGFVRFLQLNF